MKNLFVTVFLALAAALFSQTTYQQSMDEAMEEWSQSKTPQEWDNTIKRFEQIAKSYPKNWEPLYYTVLTRTINAFYLPKKEAFESLKLIESDYNELTKLLDNDETKLLKGMFLTVKVSKNPMVYGPSLTSKIMDIYHIARKENPNNPRVLYQLAEYKISGAPYMGNNPKDYCPLLEESITLFEQEAQQERKGYDPRWGMTRATELYAATCNE